LGWSVTAVRRRAGAVGNIGDVPVTWVDADIDDAPGLRGTLDGADVLYHAAAYYPHSTKRVARQVMHAVRQTRGVLAAAREAGVGRLVFTSSLTTIGAPPHGDIRLANEDDVYLPGTFARSAYYESKYAMESEVLRAAAMGLPAIVLAPTAVFGPGDVHMTMARLLAALARGWGVASIPAMTNVIDVRDCAAAHLAAATRGRAGERYLLGGHNLTVRGLMEAVARACGRPGPRWEVPLAVIEALVALGDVLPGPNRAGNHLRAVRRWSGYDCERAVRELGLAPRPLEDTLHDALEWLRQAGHLPPGMSMVR
jgi:dihydroflavonol-4-reductase